MVGESLRHTSVQTTAVAAYEGERGSEFQRPEGVKVFSGSHVPAEDSDNEYCNAERKGDSSFDLNFREGYEPLV